VYAAARRVEHGAQCTLPPVLRFRAPGSTQSAAVLVARALAIPEPRAAARVRAGAFARETPDARWARVADPQAQVLPGSALRLDAEAPPGPALGEAVEWIALVPALPWREGRAEGFAYETEEEQGGVARLRLRLAGATPEAVRAWLAAAGAPVLGDLAHGGILVAGGLRLAPAGEVLPFPDEAVFPPAAPAAEGALRISAGTARVLARGHPWVIADRETERGDRFAPGTLVALRSADGRSHGLARSEGARDLAARVWSREGVGKRSAQRGAAERSASIEERVARALARRRALLDADSGTDAVRLLHGEADALPGLAVDRLGPLLRVLVSGRAALPLRERVVAALLAAKLPGLAPDPPVVEVMHLRERPPGALACVRVVSGAREAIPDPLLVREGALRFRVESGLAEPTRPHPGVGFFLDQRDNRARLAAHAARGGRFLNLFAHTGGFSAALLAGGADEVWSVDLSAPYLAQLEENLARSGLAHARHHTVRREARRFLDELDPALRFEGVVIDPPTAAAAGRRFWSVRRDLEPLAAAALARLAPGGFLLLTRQDRAGRGRLEQLLAAAAASARVRLAAVGPAPPGADFPALAGFPEGAPFEAALATRA
jgi:23S rRNA (cytosine1962-C5)-methyltransferase